MVRNAEPKSTLSRQCRGQGATTGGQPHFMATRERLSKVILGLLSASDQGLNFGPC